MTPTQQLIAEAMLARRFRSHYALAKALGISQQRISNYTTGRNEIGEDSMIVKLAEFAGRDPLVTVAEFRALLTKDADDAGVWFQIMNRLKTAAPAAVVGVAILSTPHFEKPLQDKGCSDSGPSEQYILCSILPRQRLRLTPFPRNHFRQRVKFSFRRPLRIRQQQRRTPYALTKT